MKKKSLYTTSLIYWKVIIESTQQTNRKKNHDCRNRRRTNIVKFEILGWFLWEFSHKIFWIKYSLCLVTTIYKQRVDHQAEKLCYDNNYLGRE